MIMSQLNLCPKKVEISGLMRPSPLVNPGTLTTRLSHNPQPTSHTPNSDAPFPFLRHPQPFFTANPLIMSSLPLCLNKQALCVIDTLFLPPTTYNLRPATIEKPHFVSDH